VLPSWLLGFIWFLVNSNEEQQVSILIPKRP